MSRTGNRQGMTLKHTRKAKPEAVPPSKIRPTHSEDGVDLTLIRWFLSLTPAERLNVLQQNVRSILEQREKLKKSGRGKPFPKRKPPTQIQYLRPL